MLKVGHTGSSTQNITQVVKWMQESEKQNALIAELKAIPGRTIVFVETKKAAKSLAWQLQKYDLPVDAIHGNLSQQEREAALQSFRIGECPILVATDVASRGLDIEQITHVINYDLPTHIEDYIHRIGRTGRAGKSGRATAFFTQRNSSLAKSLVRVLRKSGQEIPSWLLEIAENDPNRN